MKDFREEKHLTILKGDIPSCCDKTGVVGGVCFSGDFCQFLPVGLKQPFYLYRV